MLGVLAAMQSEADAIIKLCTQKASGTRLGRTMFDLDYRGLSLKLCLSGIGKANAASAAQLLAFEGAGSIINAGLCGAVNQKLSIGESVLISSCLQYDFDLCALGEGPLGKIPGFFSERFNLSVPAGTGFQSAVCATGDRFSDKEEDAALLRSLNADVREMELGAAAQVCALCGISLTALKTVSNVAGREASASYGLNKAAALAALSQSFKTLMDNIL